MRRGGSSVALIPGIAAAKLGFPAQTSGGPEALTPKQKDRQLDFFYCLSASALSLGLGPSCLLPTYRVKSLDRQFTLELNGSKVWWMWGSKV